MRKRALGKNKKGKGTKFTESRPDGKIDKTIKTLRRIKRPRSLRMRTVAAKVEAEVGVAVVVVAEIVVDVPPVPTATSEVPLPLPRRRAQNVKCRPTLSNLERRVHVGITRAAA